MRITLATWLLLLLGACTGRAVIEGEPNGSTESEPPSLTGCTDPQPILQTTGEPSGFVQCADGFIHRTEVVTCAMPTTASACTVEAFSDCTTDADCNEHPLGSCGDPEFWPNGDACTCHYGCQSDADCSDDQVCACAGVVGGRSRCIDSFCGDGCGDGLCGLYRREGACGQWSGRVACVSEEVECRNDAQCQQGEAECGTSFGEVDACVISEGAWQCGFKSCGPCG